MAGSAIVLEVVFLLSFPSTVATGVTRLGPPFSSAHRFIWAQSQSLQGYGGNLTVTHKPSVNLTTGTMLFAESASVNGQPNQTGGASFSGGIGISDFSFALPAKGGQFQLNATWKVGIRVSLSSVSASYKAGGGYWFSSAVLKLQMALTYAANGTTIGFAACWLYGKHVYDAASLATLNLSRVTLGMIRSVPSNPNGTAVELRTWIFYQAQVDGLGYCSTACGPFWSTIEIGAPGLRTALVRLTLI